MNFLPLLGKHLKDDAVIEVLERSEMEVLYDFDRLHENVPDKYWAESKKEGLQLGFNANQVLDVIFLYATEVDDFRPVSREDCDILFFSTLEEAETYGVKRKLDVTKGKPSTFLGIRSEWVRLRFEAHTLHYEFRREGLALVTLMLTEA